MSDGVLLGDLRLGRKARFGETVTEAADIVLLAGDTVTATVEVAALRPERRRATLRTACTIRGEAVVPEGEAHVPVPSRHSRHGNL